MSANAKERLKGSWKRKTWQQHPLLPRAVALTLALVLSACLLPGYKRQVESRGRRVMQLWQPQSTGIAQQAFGLAAAGPACKTSKMYVPSDLEQAWLTNSKNWEQDFCSNMAAHNPAVNIWVNTLTHLTSLQQQHRRADKSPAQAMSEQKMMDPKVFSRIVTTYECAGRQRQEHSTWLEPLSHGLRHPNALCNRGADVMDRSYLLLAHRSEHEVSKQLDNVQCLGRACQTIYFDLGATTLQPGPEEAGQGWFFDAYRRQGFEFDRFLLWEAVPNPQPGDIFKNVPRSDMHKYQYFNIPVTSDTTDASNPVNILKTIAQPGDFVIFKLDIDNFKVEHDILNALMSDSDALSLIDEFFFEEHVNFREMLPYWGDTIGPNTSLSTSYDLFYGLRQKGVRAHSWV